jgi:hypothetical protein
MHKVSFNYQTLAIVNELISWLLIMKMMLQIAYVGNLILAIYLQKYF